MDEKVAMATDTANRKRVVREILEWVRAFAIAIVVALLVNTFVFQLILVDGTSMLETLQDGERMFVTKFDYLFSEPTRGDVVICNFPDRGKTNFVKRLVALPGDTVAVQDGYLYINGERMEEEAFVQYPSYRDMEQVTLEAGQYYVMGDNRAVSYDSRDPHVGPLTKQQIRGRVRGVIWPLGEIRAIQ